ncbi:MAG: hypothetical protein J6M62_10245 [Selenomonadaceae bacterium]|nr:hypothetical protein [Selenomonadaceae bacterium]
MKTIKTENAKIEVELVSFIEAGDIHIIIRTEGNNPEVVVLPASIVKSKFTDAAFIRCITDFFIKDK